MIQRSPRRCTHATTIVCRTSLILHSIGKRRLLDAHKPCQIHLGLWLMLSTICQRRLPKEHKNLLTVPIIVHVDSTKIEHTRHGLCMHTLDDFEVRCKIILSRCEKTTSDGRRPWLILPIIGRCLMSNAWRPRPCLSINVHTPWLLCKSLGWWSYPLVNVD